MAILVRPAALSLPLLILCGLCAAPAAARAEAFNVDLAIESGSMHTKCFEAFNDITRASERCVGPDCAQILKIIDLWRTKCLCDKARAASDDECKDRATESESLFWIVDAVKGKASGDSHEKRLLATRACVDDFRKLQGRFGCKPADCGAAYDEFEKWEKRCVTGQDYVPNDNVLFQVLLVKSALSVRKGVDVKQLTYKRPISAVTKDPAYAKQAAEIWGVLTSQQEQVALPRVISGCGAKCFIADVCGDYVRDAAAYLDRLFDCEREQGQVTTFEMEYREAPVLNIVKRPAARVLEGALVVMGEKDLRERVLFEKRAGLLKGRAEGARKEFSRNNVKGALDELALLYRDHQAARPEIKAAVASDLDRHGAWVGDLYRIAADAVIAKLAKLSAKPDEWVAYHAKVSACPLGPLWRDTHKDVEEFDGVVCQLNQIFKKAPMSFDEALMALDQDLAKYKAKLDQVQLERHKKAFTAGIQKCTQSTNKLLAVLRKVDGCKKSACGAKALGTIDDDRQRAQDDLDAALATLNKLIGDQAARGQLSPENEAEIRRQGKRQGCLQLVP